MLSPCMSSGIDVTLEWSRHLTTAAGIWVPRYIVEVPGSRQGRALSPSSTAYLKPVGGIAKGEGGTPPKALVGRVTTSRTSGWVQKA